MREGKGAVRRSILSLCDYTGNWSQPYLEAGYDVQRIDLQHGGDVRLLRHEGREIHGILMAPPCTHFARSGAQYWKSKGDAALLDGLSIVDACLRMVVLYHPKWWALENPIGRLADYIGPPSFKFDPCDFGDPWTKRTWLWGTFAPPRRGVGTSWRGSRHVGRRDHQGLQLQEPQERHANGLCPGVL